MLKQFVTSLFISFFSLTSISVLAETPSTGIKARVVALSLIQGDGKFITKSTNETYNNSEIVADLNVVKSQNAMVKPEANNSDQSGWLLAFALFGFVMLSNRRGV